MMKQLKQSFILNQTYQFKCSRRDFPLNCFSTHGSFENESKISSAQFDEKDRRKKPINLDKI